MRTSLDRIALVSLCLLALVAGGNCLAVEIGAGVRAGTYGVGAEVGVGFNDWIAVRGSFYTGSLSDTYTETNVEYDGDLDVGGVGVLADFYPVRGKFRLTAGLYSNDNEASLDGTPTQPVQIGDTIYTPGQIGTLTGRVEFDDTAPYLGVGWGRLTGKSRFGFLFDAGIVQQGSGELALVSSTGLVDLLDLEAEIDEIEEDIEDYDFWPVVSFGMAVRF